MSKFYQIVLGIFLLLLALLTFLEASQPPPLNWNPGYTAKDKIPLGANVLFRSLKSEDLEIKTVDKPPYEFLENENVNGTYFFLNNNLSFGEAELNRLLNWVSEGNTLFLIAKNFSDNLLDTLNLEITTAIPKNGISSKPLVNLTASGLKSENAYLFDHETYHTVFKEVDSIHSILGVSELYSDSFQITDPEINYVKASFGKGEIYLNTTPAAFSNYFLLTGTNFEYAEKALAYLPSEKTVFWDEYYKSGKAFQTSPLYVLLKNRNLKWAYYFAILGVVLFILFEGKRKQRSIPVITPLQNKTVEFTRTIAGLYLEKKEYTQIAHKKITYFKENIRTQLRVPTSEVNEDFFHKIAALSNKTVSEIKDLFALLEKLEQKNTISKGELLELNSAIQSFKTNNYGK